jgi:hypothetical protein
MSFKLIEGREGRKFLQVRVDGLENILKELILTNENKQMFYDVNNQTDFLKARVTDKCEIVIEWRTSDNTARNTTKPIALTQDIIERIIHELTKLIEEMYEFDWQKSGIPDQFRVLRHPLIGFMSGLLITYFTINQVPHSQIGDIDAILVGFMFCSQLYLPLVYMMLRNNEKLSPKIDFITDEYNKITYVKTIRNMIGLFTWLNLNVNKYFKPTMVSNSNQMTYKIERSPSIEHLNKSYSNFKSGQITMRQMTHNELSEAMENVNLTGFKNRSEPKQQRIKQEPTIDEDELDAQNEKHLREAEFEDGFEPEDEDEHHVPNYEREKEQVDIGNKKKTDLKNIFKAKGRK